MNRRGVFCVVMAVFTTTACLSDQGLHNSVNDLPWLTGPLLAFAGTTMAAGDVDVEPYVYVMKTDRANALYTQSLQMQVTQGLGKRFDFQILVPYTWNEVSDHRYSGFQDVVAMLGFQAFLAPDHTMLPSLRMALQETFPNGKYNHLNPSRFQADSTGQGVYQTAVCAFFTESFYLPREHYLSTDLSLIYTLPATASVNGFNTYGGGLDTQGQVNNGGSFFADFAFEYPLTKNWVLASDVTYTYDFTDSFNGYLGFGSDGLPASVGNPVGQSVSLAPAIEYNFSERFGVIAGVWFSVYTHNINNFVSGVIAFNYFS